MIGLLALLCAAGARARTACERVAADEAPELWDITKVRHHRHQRADNLDFAIRAALLDQLQKLPSEFTSALGHAWHNETALDELILEEPLHREPLVLHGEWHATTDGYVADPRNCSVFRQGGCTARGGQGFLALSSDNADLHRFDTVVTLAAHWSYGFWHFPMEAVTGLADVDIERRMDEDQELVVHVSQRSEYVRQWLEIVGVHNWTRVVSGYVATRRQLVVPRMSRCGKPYLHNLRWLRTRVLDALPGWESSTERQYFVLVRQSHRGLINYYQVAAICREYADILGLHFYEHDDRDLPPLRAQLAAFANAAVIVAPHGAALTLAVASPARTCMIEMVSPSNLAPYYMRLAYLLNFNYYGTPLERSGTARLADVEWALDECREKILTEETNQE